MRHRSDYDPNPLRGIERLVIFAGIGLIVLIVIGIVRWVVSLF